MKKLPVLVALAILLSAAGCQREQQPAAESGKPEAAVKSAPATAAFEIELSTQPDKLRLAEDAVFQVTLRDQKGEPVENARVSADLVMPMMDMGENKVRFTPKGNGVYQGKGQFSMAGPWEVRVTAGAGGKSESKVFDVRVEE